MDCISNWNVSVAVYEVDAITLMQVTTPASVQTLSSWYASILTGSHSKRAREIF